MDPEILGFPSNSDPPPPRRYHYLRIVSTPCSQAYDRKQAKPEKAKAPGFRV